MQKQHIRIQYVITLLGVATLGTSFIAKAADKEETVTIESIPAAAAKAIKDSAAGAKIEKVSKENDEGKTVFEAKITKKEHVEEVSVNADGKIVSEEKVISLGEAPHAVRKAVEEAAASRKVEKLERVKENGNVTFEALITGNSKREEVVFSAEGRVVWREDKTGDKAKD